MNVLLTDGFRAKINDSLFLWDALELPRRPRDPTKRRQRPSRDWTACTYWIILYRIYVTFCNFISNVLTFTVIFDYVSCWADHI